MGKRFSGKKAELAGLFLSVAMVGGFGYRMLHTEASGLKVEVNGVNATINFGAACGFAVGLVGVAGFGSSLRRKDVSSEPSP